MEHTEEDERYDSSPGFDVFVDDRDSNKNDYEHEVAGERYANGPYVEYDGGDSVDYGLNYIDSECYEREFCGFDSACYPVDSFYLDRFKEHDTVIKLGHIPHDRINLENSTFEEYDRGSSILQTLSALQQMLPLIISTLRLDIARREGPKSLSELLNLGGKGTIL